MSRAHAVKQMPLLSQHCGSVSGFLHVLPAGQQRRKGALALPHTVEPWLQVGAPCAGEGQV